MYSTAFLRAINFVLSEKIEGGFSDDENDPGNWTGGEKGKGELVGTKWGISAARYPSMDIRGLRRDEAISLYWRDYWLPIQGEYLPPRLSLVVFDCAVNQGIETASKLLQSVVGVETDGVIGQITLGAVRAREPEDTLVDFLAARALRYAKTKNFERYGRGWYRRLFFSALESIR